MTVPPPILILHSQAQHSVDEHGCVAIAADSRGGGWARTGKIDDTL